MGKKRKKERNVLITSSLAFWFRLARRSKLSEELLADIKHKRREQEVYLRFIDSRKLILNLSSLTSPSIINTWLILI